MLDLLTWKKVSSFQVLAVAQKCLAHVFRKLRFGVAQAVWSCWFMLDLQVCKKVNTFQVLAASQKCFAHVFRKLHFGVGQTMRSYWFMLDLLIWKIVNTFQVLAVAQKCFAQCLSQTRFWCCKSTISLTHACFTNMQKSVLFSRLCSRAKTFCPGLVSKTVSYKV